jgi:hypothetical protein
MKQPRPDRNEWSGLDNPALIARHCEAANSLIGDCEAFEAQFRRPLHPQNGLKTGSQFRFEIHYSADPRHVVHVAYGNSEVRLILRKPITDVSRSMATRTLLGPGRFDKIELSNVERAQWRRGDGRTFVRVIVGGIPTSGAIQ